MSKSIKSRIQNKHDLATNWEQAKNFVPLAGELIVYEAEYDAELNPSGSKYPKIKIGDGVINSETNTVEGTSINDLPFVMDPYCTKDDVDSTIGTLISSGTADPSDSVTSKFYFKYSVD